KNTPTATMMLGMMMGDSTARYTIRLSREAQRDTATAAGTASSNERPAVIAAITTLCHVESSHPAAVKYFTYHWSENPGGGNTKNAAELKERGIIRITGATRNTSTPPPEAGCSCF